MQGFKTEMIKEAILVAAEYSLRVKNTEEITGKKHPETLRQLVFATKFIKAMVRSSGLSQIELCLIKDYTRSCVHETVDKLLDDLFNEKEAPDATDPLSRH